MNAPLEHTDLTAEERNWGALSHVTSFLGYFLFLGQFIPPLVIYFTKKDRSPFIADQAKESLNFQINVVLALLIGAVLFFTGIFTCVGLPILILTGVADLVFVLIATIKAHEGEAYRYPVSLRFF